MSATPTSVTDDLDELLGIDDTIKPKPAAEEPSQEAVVDDEPEETPAAEAPEPETPDVEEPVEDEAPAVEEKPKRTRRTKAQIEADNAAKVASERAASVSSLSTAEAEEAYLAELQRRLQAGRDGLDGVSKPEAELTPVQRQIREAEDSLAKQTAQNILSGGAQFEEAPKGSNVLLIHIVNDGLVINGQMTYRGQEFEFEIGGLAYRQTQDTLGRSFLELADDIDAQYRRWGEQKIALGPWRGKRQVGIEDAPSGLTPEQKREWLADMNQHLAAEDRRSKAAPVLRGLGA